MAFLQRFLKYITLINEQLGKIAGWVALAMVLIVTLDVIMRYLFNLTFVCVQELEWHLFGVLFLLGAGYTLAHDGHVRVDIFYQRLNKRQQAWINLIGVIVFLLPGCFLVVDTSYNFFSIPFTCKKAHLILEGFLPAMCSNFLFLLVLLWWVCRVLHWG